MESFSFAGFSFPRHVPLMRAGKPRGKRWSFAYSCAPVPLSRRKPFAPRAEFGFYLDSDFAPGLRWQWADECEDSPVNHRGWFTDGAASETIRGIVLRLPRSRGFLAGYALGEGMSATLEREIYESEREAAGAADRMADRAAEREREYQAAWSAGTEAAEAERESIEARGEALELMRDMRAARLALAWLAGPERETAERLCGRLRSRAEALAETWRDKRAERDKLRREWRDAAGFADGYGEA